MQSEFSGLRRRADCRRIFPFVSQSLTIHASIKERKGRGTAPFLASVPRPSKSLRITQDWLVRDTVRSERTSRRSFPVAGKIVGIEPEFAEGSGFVGAKWRASGLFSMSFPYPALVGFVWLSGGKHFGYSPFVRKFWNDPQTCAIPTSASRSRHANPTKENH